jgi:hypothetical protein
VVRHLWGADPGPNPGDFTLRPFLAPLEAYKSQLVVVDGLANNAAGQSGGHGPRMATLWNGASGPGSDSDWGRGATIDQLIAAELNAGTKYQSLEFRARSPQDYGLKGPLERMIYSAASSPKDPWEDVASAASSLFAGVGAPPPSSSVDPAIAMKKQLFTHLDGELAALIPKLCTDDRAQLQALRNGYNGLQAQLSSGSSAMASSACGKPTVTGTKAFDKTIDDMIQILVMSLACDLTRVASLQFSMARSPATLDWLSSFTLSSGTGSNSGEDHHTISHEAPGLSNFQGNNPARPDDDQPSPLALTQFAVPIKKLLDINVYYATKIASLVKGLSMVPVGGGKTLLDQCVICWGNELDNGGEHNHAHQPFVLIGGGGGALKGGQVLRFPLVNPYSQHPWGPPTRSHNDLLVTLAQWMGVATIKSVGDTALNQGPII